MNLLIRSAIAVAVAVVFVVVINLIGNVVIPQPMASKPAPMAEATPPAEEASEDAPAMAEQAAETAATMAEQVAETAATMTEEAAEQATAMTEEATEQAATMAEQATEQATAMAEEATEQAPGMAEETAEKAEAMAEDAMEKPAEMAEQVAAAAPTGDAAAGEKTAKKCKACHTFEEGGKNKVGPHLFGVIGREAGSVEDFKYSDAFKAAAPKIGAWEPAEVVEYVADPTAYLRKVTGDGGAKSKMTFKLKGEEDRANIAAYLATLK